MSQYPNPGQDPNQPQGQYPSQGEHTQYPPNYGTPPYNGQQQQQVFQQPPYQQGGYQQPPYQQPPYAQAPYQQVPYQQAPAISLDYRNIIAGVGALVAAIAFFLPFYASQPYYIGNTIYPGTTTSGAQEGGRVWLDFVIALVALAAVVLLQFGEQWFKTSTSPQMQRLVTSLTTQKKAWYIGLIALGVFGIFFHFILDIGLLSVWGIGSWLFLLGLIAIVVGAVLFVRPPAPAPAPIPQQPFPAPGPGGPTSTPQQPFPAPGPGGPTSTSTSAPTPPPQ